MSCGNIKKAIRSKLTAQCWLLVAQIPVAKFEPIEFQGILTRNLYHQCMDVVTARLKEHSHVPFELVDAEGFVRFVRTFLLAHLADNPEQQLIACVSANQSPVSVAQFHQLGDPEAHALRHGAKTIQSISALPMGPDISLRCLEREAKRAGLNGVREPFWRDWRFADPSTFLSPDALHQLHRMFLDHPVKWARKLVGDAEIDKRLSALQKRIGSRHFRNGFTRFKQHTGREQRDIERVFIGVIAGHKSVNPRIMAAFRALLDFIYLAQYESHSSDTLRYLRDALIRFHNHKEALSVAGVRDGKRRKGLFNIRKVEMMHHVPRFVERLGSAMQYSTDQTEHCHINMAKVPYEATNKRNYGIQMCRYLDRLEKIHVFTMYQVWLDGGHDDVSIDDTLDCLSSYGNDLEERGALEVDDPDNGGLNGDDRVLDGSLRLEALGLFARHFLPRTAKDFFQESASTTPRNETTAFRLTSRIPSAGTSVEAASTTYNLPDFRDALLVFHHGVRGRSTLRLSYKRIDIWNSVRMQLRAVQNEDFILLPQTVKACPRSGLYNFVLVKEAHYASYSGIQGSLVYMLNDQLIMQLSGHFVAQLRMVFRPCCRSRTSEILAYVQPFKPAPGTISQQEDGSKAHVPDDYIEMFRVVRSLHSDGKRKGLIIRLTDIWRPVELIPRFGKKCPVGWTSSNAVELADHFYVNCFSDKEAYQSIY